MRATHDMSFSEALRALKGGKKVCRSGWNGKGMWLRLVRSTGYGVDIFKDGALEYGGAAISGDRSATGLEVHETLPWVGMKTADNKFVPWLCSQTDMLAEDWMVVG